MKFLIVYILLIIPSVLMAGTLEFVFSDFPPFEYLENGKPAGMNKEIIEEACKRLDLTPVFRQLPWKRALAYTQNGSADAVFSLFKNAERMAYYSYPDENINRVKMVLITNKTNDIIVETMTDLRGKTIGVYRGSSYGNEFDKDDLIIKSPVNKNELLLKKQAAGRTDLIVLDELVARYWCRRLNMENTFKTLPYIITTNPTYVAFSKAREKITGKSWAPRFSKILTEMKNDGFMDGLRKKYAFQAAKSN